MKIIHLIAENFKRIQAVDIVPDGPVVQVTGRNGQGKTSVLDAIWAALAGKDAVPGVPIRVGEDEARITLDLGEVVVTRTFAREREGPGYTTKITVMSADGAKFPSPQRMLDDMLGALTFDPLEFARMEPRRQFDLLKRFVPDVDFDALDRATKTDYDNRTEINRRLRDARTAVDRIIVPPGTPAEPTDASKLSQQLRDAAAANEEYANENMRRTMERERVATLLHRADELERQAETLRQEAAAAAERMAELKDVPPPFDLGVLQADIEQAIKSNAAVELRRNREWAKEQVAQLERQAEELTERMKAREEQKRAAIAAAAMPVPGLDFGDGVVLFNGVPFDQASDAEKLRTSLAIAMAGDPKMRVARVRDGSLLDSASLAIVNDMARQHDFQVWIEIVREDNKVGFVIEDGKVASHAEG